MHGPLSVCNKKDGQKFTIFINKLCTQYIIRMSEFIAVSKEKKWFERYTEDRKMDFQAEA